MGLRSTIGSLFLPSPAKDLNVDSIKAGAKMSGDSISSMTDSVRKERRVETFEDALSRLGITEDKLVRRRRELMIESRLMYAICVGSLVFAAYSAVSGELFGVFGALCTILIGGVGGFTKAFRVHQIDRRDLMAFKTFLAEPEGWFK